MQFQRKKEEKNFQTINYRLSNNKLRDIMCFTCQSINDRTALACFFLLFRDQMIRNETSTLFKMHAANRTHKASIINWSVSQFFFMHFYISLIKIGPQLFVPIVPCDYNYRLVFACPLHWQSHSVPTMINAAEVYIVCVCVCVTSDIAN